MSAPRPDAVQDAQHSRRAALLLGLGAGVGLLVAAVGLMRTGPTAGLPGGVVASVNGEVIREEQYVRAVAALASDRRDPIGPPEKRHVLDRMLEEELLVQRGLELGLARHDRRVRGDIVSAVIQAVVTQTDGSEPEPDELAAFYAENSDYFAQTGRLLVEQIIVRAGPTRTDEEATLRAVEVVARLRGGEPFAAVDEALGDTQVAPIPRDYLPAPKLREYLGPTATAAAMRLAPGDVSDPVRSSLGYHVLRLVDHETGRVPPLAEVENQVFAEWRRRQGDRALREYLDALREQADVRIATELP